MQQIERDVLIEDSFQGVTVGALIFPHGTIMIDAPLRLDDARTWQSILLNQRKGSNRLLILLDTHPDRTLGARAMESTILAHQNAAEIFSNRPMIFKGFNVESGAVWETYSEAIGMRWAVPDITFSEQMTLHWGEPEVVLEYHPGPTSCTIWVIIPEYKIVFVGDTIMLDQPVFLADADLDQWLESLDILKKSFKDYRIICGRGGIADIVAIRAQIRYIKRILRGIERLAENAATPEATKKMVKPLLRGLSYPAERHDLYVQRLQYGLYHYYTRRYGINGVYSKTNGEEGD